MNPGIVQRIHTDLGISVSRIEATLALLDGGATVPFIARYRKEATANLDEAGIGDIADRYAHHRKLDERRAFILGRLGRKELLSEDLRQKIEAASTPSELEDLYLPYRPRRQSRAGTARKRGLEPLADYIQAPSWARPVEEMAAGFVSADGEVPTVDAAIDGALDIVAERIAENADIRQWLRGLFLARGVVQARAARGPDAEKTKYSTYYDFHEPVARIPSHRFLAVRRGSREKVLSYTITLDAEPTRQEFLRRLNFDPDCPWLPLLVRASDDAYKRLLEPSIQTEVRSLLRARADSEAIRVFRENLRALLLAPPAGAIPVLGVDPGIRTGSRLAVVDPRGKFLETATIFLTGPEKDLEVGERALLDLVSRHGVRGIAIGNGTGSRESEEFIRTVVGKNKLDVFVLVVSEAGASVYSASEGARQEFANLDLPVRGAISIARRLQDPLAELVKVDPKAIGVGQYQHDVNQKKLRSSLGATVESAVNQVGVDLNTASRDLLKYVSGIPDALASALVEYRNLRGAFRNRLELHAVPGLGEKAFELAAGFVRISDPDHPLDRTSIHPESYPAVERIAASAGVPLAELVGNPSRVQDIRFGDFEQEVGRFTLADIRQELMKPGRDPRRCFVLPQFRADVRDVGDLEPGMDLEGQVTNVTNFGAFVDIGVHQDGLVHISELSHRYISDARKAIGVGDLVKVRVIAVDREMKRISLSRRALLPKPRPRPKSKPAPRTPLIRTSQVNSSPDGSEARSAAGKRPLRVKTRVQAGPKQQREDRASPPAPPPVSMEEKIRLLQEKFRGPAR
jgi:uncharacterized protein